MHQVIGLFFQVEQMEEAARTEAEAEAEAGRRRAAGARTARPLARGLGKSSRVLCLGGDCPPSVLLNFF